MDDIAEEMNQRDIQRALPRQDVQQMMDPPGMMLLEGLINGYQEAFNRAEERRQSIEAGEAAEIEAHMESSIWLLQFLPELMTEFQGYAGTWDTPEGNFQNEQALQYLTNLIASEVYVSRNMRDRAPQTVVDDIIRQLEGYERLLDAGNFDIRTWGPAQGA